MGAGRTAKVYCERCDEVFAGRAEFARHLESHSGAHAEACPIDTALSRLASVLRRRLPGGTG